MRFTVLVLSFAGVLACASAASAQWFSQTYQSSTGLTNLAQAEAALASGTFLGSGFVPVVNFADLTDPGFGGTVPGNIHPFGLHPIGGGNDFVVESRGYLTVVTTGIYTFINNTDDGSKLTLDGVDIILDDVLSADHDAPSSPILLTAGSQFPIRHLWFDRNFGAEGELTYTRDGGPRLLVGDTPELLVSPVPEPSTIALAGLALACLVGRRRVQAAKRKTATTPIVN